jgi:hypothetical protein
MKSVRRLVVSGVLAAACAGVLTARARATHAQPGRNVSGAWSTQFAGAAANVSLTQSGANVVGIYVNSPPLLPGAMAGILRGNVLVGRWTDAHTSGGFALTFSPDGRSFAGTWGRTIDSNTSGGPWVGNR